MAILCTSVYRDTFTVKGFNFAVLKVRGFLDGTFRGGFNFADYSIATYI